MRHKDAEYSRHETYADRAYLYERFANKCPLRKAVSASGYAVLR